VQAALLEVHLADVERGGPPQPLAERRHRDERLLDLGLEGLGSPLPVLARAGVQPLGLRDHGLGLDHRDRGAREVLPRRHRRLRYEGEELDDLVGHEAAVQALEEGPSLAAVFDALGEDRAQRCQGGAGREHVRQGQERELGVRRDRALGLGVEAAEALDRVAQELEADRAVEVGREHIEDPAAPRHLARARDRVFPAVAALVEGLEQDLRRHLLAGPEREHAGLEEPRGERRPQEAGG
jgi:hypothetical protein